MSWVSRRTDVKISSLEKIKPYLSNTERPVVTVRMSSYRVTVSGEVGNPGVVPVTTEKMSVIGALASVGDPQSWQA